LLLENEFPVIIVSFQTSEILGYTDKKTGKYISGADDNVISGRYALAFTKKQLIDPDASHNPKTNGWYVLQWSESKK
jgi:import inner membrane translocase subunit TIM44